MSLEKTVKRAIWAGLRPILLSAPGAGKTMFVRWLSRRLDALPIIFCPSHKEGVETNGQPVVSPEPFHLDGVNYTVVEQAPPKFVLDILKNPNQKYLIFMDEITNATATQLSSLLVAMTEGIIGDVKLPLDRTAIVAAANPPETSEGCHYISAAFANRLHHIPFVVDPVEWTNNFATYWGNPPQTNFLGYTIDEGVWQKQRALVAAFINSARDQLHALPKQMKDRSGAWPSPRTWDAASKVLAVIEQDKGSRDEAISMLQGIVGPGAAVAFANFWEHGDLPDPVKILANPGKFVVPDRDDLAFMVVASCRSELARVLRNNPPSKTGKSAKQYAAVYDSAWKIAGKLSRAGRTALGALFAHDLVSPEFKLRDTTPSEVIFEFEDILQTAGVDWSAA